MAQAEIDARTISFISGSVIPTADQVRNEFTVLDGFRDFYIINEFSVGATNEIVDLDTVPFWFPALHFHQWHDLIFQFGNFAAGNAVNGGAAFRFRLFYEQLLSGGLTITTPATSDPILQAQYDHMQQGIELARGFELAIGNLDKALGFHISNQYGVGGANQITDALLLSGNFRFTANDYNSWMNMAQQAVNFASGNAAVTPGAFEQINFRIVTAGQ